ncbi:hypothetical protein GCM10027034_11300 [Ramlibacter solisilvae]|uniref:bile acid:sodium symporter family protein n=1 Tax=Ramlibacter tataouinensis TaxID=94132 RepID=UPI0007775463|nr:hypothetical protein [Ramlibacter tataouinensis]
MDAAQLIQLALQASVALLIFSIGVNATFSDLTFLARRPGLLLRSLLAMNVVMPCIAIALYLIFDPPAPVPAVLVGLSLAPVPPILPKKELKAGGARSYVLGLLAAAALFAIVFVPVAAHLIAQLFGRVLNVSPVAVAKVVAISILVPILAGVCFRRIAPQAAQRLSLPLARLGGVLLLVASLPVLIGEWPAVKSLIGNFSVLVFALFVAAGLAVGHWLGGPDPEDRSVLALSTATRHPGVTIVMTQQMADMSSILAAVMLAFVVTAVVSAPYVIWRRRSIDAVRSREAAPR